MLRDFIAARARTAFWLGINVVNFTPGGRLGGEILKFKARSSRFLNFKRRKGFAVKKFGGGELCENKRALRRSETLRKERISPQ